MFRNARELLRGTMKASGRILSVDEATSTSTIATAAVAVLRQGGIVALPTDTLYGVTATLDCAQRLFDVKRRSPLKPLGLFVARPEDVANWAEVTIPSDLLHRLLPGPVTLMFNRLPTLPPGFNPETTKVGVRVPVCPLVNEICRRLGAPLAQTSANPSGSPLNPLCIADFAVLQAELDLIVDGGEIRSSAEGSTIVDLSRPGVYRIVRDGCALVETETKLKAAGLARNDT